MLACIPFLTIINIYERESWGRGVGKCGLAGWRHPAVLCCVSLCLKTSGMIHDLLCASLPWLAVWPVARASLHASRMHSHALLCILVGSPLEPLSEALDTCLLCFPRPADGNPFSRPVLLFRLTRLTKMLRMPHIIAVSPPPALLGWGRMAGWMGGGARWWAFACTSVATGGRRGGRGAGASGARAVGSRLGG